MTIWDDEDGDRFFAVGHHDFTTMVDGVIKWLADLTFDEYAPARFDPDSLSQYWVITNPDDEERYLVVASDTPSAEPMTRVDLL